MISKTSLITMLMLVSLLGLVMVNVSNAQVKSPSAPVSQQISPIDINTATSFELTKLPGIGEKMAARIIEYRSKNGNFKSIEEIMNVKGISEKKFQRIKDHIVIKKPQASK